MCRKVFGDNVDKLPKETYNKYFSTNPKALEAFIDRKTAGLNLSDRVWKYTDQFKEEIEMGLDVGIRDGLSSDKMSRQLRTYLKYPDKLFRRVRDEHGYLRLSNSAAAFHPGQGVYRSSYKNARRLAATESNIAYRTSDYLRWQDLDFVVGIEIHLSNNHTLNGKPFKDICDHLKGRYPKTFKWTGWHPLCRCYATTVQKTDEEFMEDNRRILRGEEPLTDSKNMVKEFPDNFNEWVKENQERIESAKSLPYFVRDNKSVVDNILEPQKDEQGNSAPKKSDKDLDKAVKETAQKAHEVGDEVQGLAESIAAKYGAVCTPINYKSEESIKRKVLTEQLKDPSYTPDMLKDAVRTTIIVPRDKIEDVIDTLKKNDLFLRYKPQDGEEYIGYIGNIINLKTSNGLTAEIQINTAKMIYAKELPENAKKILGEKVWNAIRREVEVEGGLGHKYYEEWRVMSDEEKLSVKGQTLKKKSEEYYSHFKS